MNIMHEKTARIKYIRVVDKFISRAFSLAKVDDMDFETFKQKIDKFYKEFKKTPKVELYSTYSNMQHSYIDMVLTIANSDGKNYEEYKQKLIKEANLLDKHKNSTSYKKDKHKTQSFNDGY
ncbi:MAG: hypothetical protein M0P43_02535 [Arcobacteraceae bacterium]|jgi:hypothetical protein|nr:hypothetical protein [Arcobacteraceae bacterium]MDY0328665.1 hypothetical protein [Arcobacteraceae bacterium]